MKLVEEALPASAEIEEIGFSRVIGPFPVLRAGVPAEIQDIMIIALTVETGFLFRGNGNIREINQLEPNRPFLPHGKGRISGLENSGMCILTMILQLAP